MELQGSVGLQPAHVVLGKLQAHGAFVKLALGSDHDRVGPPGVAGQPTRPGLPGPVDGSQADLPEGVHQAPLHGLDLRRGALGLTASRVRDGSARELETRIAPQGEGQLGEPVQQGLEVGAIEAQANDDPIGALALPQGQQSRPDLGEAPRAPLGNPAQVVLLLGTVHGDLVVRAPPGRQPLDSLGCQQCPVGGHGHAQPCAVASGHVPGRIADLLHDGPGRQRLAPVPVDVEVPNLVLACQPLEQADDPAADLAGHPFRFMSLVTIDAAEVARLCGQEHNLGDSLPRIGSGRRAQRCDSRSDSTGNTVFLAILTHGEASPRGVFPVRAGNTPWLSNSPRAAAQSFTVY